MYHRQIFITHCIVALKGPFTQLRDFCRATQCNFCRADVASSFEHVRDFCDIAAILSPLVYAGANSRRFYGDFIGATKIALSCATKFDCVNGP